MDKACDSEPANNLLTKSGKVKASGLLNAKKPALNKFSNTRASGLPRKAKM